MITLVTALGKGLRDTAYPYQAHMAFGAPLNSPADWRVSGTPSIVEPGGEYNVVALTPPCELCVCLATGKMAVAGDYVFAWEWFREPEHVLLGSFAAAGYLAAGSDWYNYSWFGLVPWEVDRNGRYLAQLVITGPEGTFAQQFFEVVGIAGEEPEPALVGYGLDGLQGALYSASARCYDVYLTVLSWIYPFWLLAEPFYGLSELFLGAGVQVGNFARWVTALADQVRDVLSWDSVKALILDWLPWLPDLAEWFANASDNVSAIIGDWWTTAEETVKGWIASATEGLGDLRTAWGEFTSDVLPSLVNLSYLGDWWGSRLEDVQGLIGTAFTVRENLWDGWVAVRNQVVELVQDPEAWLVARIESMLVRFW